MQPGSSVATSLMPGEAVTKNVAILEITGKQFKVETIRLKTVRPFIMKEVILQNEPGMKAAAKKENNRTEITRHLISVVESLIEEAKAGWLEAQDEDIDEGTEAPLPLIRLRVEYTAPDGGKYDCENPQRFSNRFVGKVANVNDVIQFHRKKTAAARMVPRRERLWRYANLYVGKAKDGTEMPEESIMAQLSIDTVKVEKLVREFLTAQSLTILPQNSFGDAVSQYVDKDDKHAMELFVTESLTSQIKHLLNVDEFDEDDLTNAMDQQRSKLEELFAAGHLKKHKKRKLKPKPAHWDSDIDGEWAEQPGAVVLSDREPEDDEEESIGSAPPRAAASRGRGKAAATTTRGASTRKPAAAKAKAPMAKGGRGKKKAVEEDEDDDDDDDNDDDDDDDVQMLDEDEDEEEDEPPVRKTSKAAPKKAPSKRAASPVKRAPPRAAATSRTASTRQTQSKLSFSQPQAATQTRAKGKAVQEIVSSDSESKAKQYND